MATGSILLPIVAAVLPDGSTSFEDAQEHLVVALRMRI
jgi:hypothetical protein